MCRSGSPSRILAIDSCGYFSLVITTSVYCQLLTIFDLQVFLKVAEVADVEEEGTVKNWFSFQVEKTARTSVILIVNVVAICKLNCCIS